MHCFPRAIPVAEYSSCCNRITQSINLMLCLCQVKHSALVVCAASGEVGELLDRAVLIYRLGAVQAFKGSQYQLQGQDAALAQVCTGSWLYVADAARCPRLCPQKQLLYRKWHICNTSTIAGMKFQPTIGSPNLK